MRISVWYELGYGLQDAMFRHRSISKSDLDELQNMLTCFKDATILLRTPFRSGSDSLNKLLNGTTQSMKTHAFFKSRILDGWEISKDFSLDSDGKHYHRDLHHNLTQEILKIVMKK